MTSEPWAGACGCRSRRNHRHGLLTRVANEKSLLVIALLCWAYLLAWILRQAMGLRPTVRRSATTQDLNSLNFSGMDRGFQGFGIYMHDVRVGNDPIEDDTH
jgi:hypothetical protein